MSKDFESPGSNLLGEALCSIFMRLVKLTGDTPEREPLVPTQPVSTTPLNRWCGDCKTGTLQLEQVWVIEEITTYECRECGSVTITE